MPWAISTSTMMNVLSRKPEKRYSAQQKDGFFFPIYHSPRAVDLSPPAVHMGPPPPYYRLYPPAMSQQSMKQEQRRSYSPPAELPPPPSVQQLVAPPPPSQSLPPPPPPSVPTPASGPVATIAPAPVPDRRPRSPPRHSIAPAPIPHVLRRRSSSIESFRPMEDLSPVASPRRTLSRRHTLTSAPSALFEAGPSRVPAIAVTPPTSNAARSVRFHDNLICASPRPKRVGWYNRRGDQLWTNDGGFVEVSPGEEYPRDLEGYPEPGTGWQNEQGVRIDLRHRIIPKQPLRSALKQRNTL